MQSDHLIVDQPLCDQCGTCLSVCPVECLHLTLETLEVDQDACIKCSLCLPICPTGALALQATQPGRTV